MPDFRVGSIATKLQVSTTSPLSLRNSLSKRTSPIGRNGPCVDGSGLARRIITLQQWSEQPCVRPVCAVHVTAGHNALRGSGPGQKHAFEDAMAHVGCPDRRIDRRCIKCCSPPNHYVTPISGVISSRLVTPRERLVPCSVRSWPSSPRPSWRVCWRAQWLRP